MLLEVVTGACADAGITRSEVDFTCAGSCDYVAGQAFSFVQNIDAVGAWPPKRDSHVEMDGAWALYEAWVRLLEGDIGIAVAMGSGRSSTADPALHLPDGDGPLLPGAARRRRAQLRRAAGPGAPGGGQGDRTPDGRGRGAFPARRQGQCARPGHAATATSTPSWPRSRVRHPLRRHDLPPITDGACAVVIARADVARAAVPSTRYGSAGSPTAPSCTIRACGICASRSRRTRAAEAAGIGDGPIEVAEIQAAFTHEEPLLVEALGLAPDVAINPSGGALAANPVMATGLVRIAEAAGQIRDNGPPPHLGPLDLGPVPATEPRLHPGG